MADQIPIATIKALARSVFKEATKYGFGQLDVVRLVNELMDECTTQEAGTPESPATQQRSTSLTSDARNLPLTGNRLKIRSFDATSDLALLQTWMSDSYGRDFVLSSMSARSVPIEMSPSVLSRTSIMTFINARPSYESLSVILSTAARGMLRRQPDYG
ncbi:MAG: hypothetical protein P8X81_00660 [Woeseiaceae bacterium]